MINFADRMLEFTVDKNLRGRVPLTFTTKKSRLTHPITLLQVLSEQDSDSHSDPVTFSTVPIETDSLFNSLVALSNSDGLVYDAKPAGSNGAKLLDPSGLAGGYTGQHTPPSPHVLNNANQTVSTETNFNPRSPDGSFIRQPPPSLPCLTRSASFPKVGEGA